LFKNLIIEIISKGKKKNGEARSGGSCQVVLLLEKEM